MDEIATFPKPNPRSFFFWRHYFSDNPASALEEDGVYYDRDGNLNAPAYRKWYPYDCYFYCPSDSHSSGCGDFIVILAIVIAVVAVIVAAAMVFSYPPIMILSWIVLVVGSLIELGGTSDVCKIVRIYNLTSAILVLCFFFYLVANIRRLQTCYRGFYPGTPGVSVDVRGLEDLFLANKRGFIFACFPALCIMVWGIILVASCYSNSATRTCDRYNLCIWTTITSYFWVFIHFLNFVAAVSMARRMQAKYNILQHPPAYTEQSGTSASAAGPVVISPSSQKEMSVQLPPYEAPDKL
ncbi:hypothetical protein HDU91_004322 [Kappamyces sp. JEL0680]|nr:hypothetical protein HDU91_004322 [Kappamyces sp. JEL0680]